MCWLFNFFKNTLLDIRNDPSFWNAWTAIGTVAVAIVAVWKERLVPEPNLILGFANRDGARVPLMVPGRGMLISCYYHLRVRNLRQGILAKNVRVLIRRIQFLDPQPAVRELHPPRQLAWAPAELEELSPSFLHERTLDAVRVLRDHAEITLIGMPFSGDHIITWGRNVVISLEVVADNLSRVRFYELTCTWLEASPRADFETNPVGYLDLQIRKIR